MSHKNFEKFDTNQMRASKRKRLNTRFDRKARQRMASNTAANQRDDKQEHAVMGKPKKSYDYDVLVRLLQFYSKAKPQDKLETEEEIEKEIVEKLKQKEVIKLISIA